MVGGAAAGVEWQARQPVSVRRKGRAKVRNWPVGVSRVADELVELGVALEGADDVGLPSWSRGRPGWSG